jgi:hypothetical protein
MLAVALVFSGCATTPYRFAAQPESELTLPLRPDEPQIERGKPNAWIDGFGHYFFSLPTKLLLLNWKVDNHHVPPEVEQALQTYLHANGLCQTKVRLNQYAPGAEWRRLFHNQEMPAGWRYSLGLISVAIYTIFPERLFAGFPFIGGGDNYNPYTNTLSIYSGSRPIVLHEGGHAKDIGRKENRHWQGAYAGLRAVPLLGLGFALWQEGVASSEALSWDLATAGSRESKSAYRTLYPAYGTYLGGVGQSVGVFFTDGWILYAVQYGMVVVGHVAGQTRALFVRKRAEGLEPELIQSRSRGASETDIDTIGATNPAEAILETEATDAAPTAPSRCPPLDPTEPASIEPVPVESAPLAPPVPQSAPDTPESTEAGAPSSP